MARGLARRARGARWWLGCLVVCGVLGCKGSGDDAGKTPEAQAAPDSGTGNELVRAAQRRPDGGSPDAGRVRLELEGVPRPEADAQGPCPPGTHRCCEGSCSPDKRCPGVACDPIPTMSE